MEIWKKIEDYPNYSVSSMGGFRNDKTKRVLKKSLETILIWIDTRGAFEQLFMIIKN